MKTVTCRPESKAEEMVNILVKRADCIRKIGEQCLTMLMKNFKWSQQTAFAFKALLDNQKVVAIIDTGSSGVVIFKSCFKSLV